jgi:hypothetical protein
VPLVSDEYLHTLLSKNFNIASFEQITEELVTLFGELVELRNIEVHDFDGFFELSVVEHAGFKFVLVLPGITNHVDILLISWV